MEQNNPNVNTKVVFDPRNGKIIEITEADDYDLTYGSDSLKAMQKDAMQLWDMGKFDEAKNLFRRIIEKSEDEAVKRLNEGRIFMIDEEFEKAKEEYEKAYEMDKNNPDISNELAYFYIDMWLRGYWELVDSEKMIFFAEKAHELWKNNITYRELGLAYMIDGNNEKAEKIFKEINDDVSKYWLAQLYANTNRTEESKKILKELLIKGFLSKKQYDELMENLFKH